MARRRIVHTHACIELTDMARREFRVVSEHEDRAGASAALLVLRKDENLMAYAPSRYAVVPIDGKSGQYLLPLGPHDAPPWDGVVTYKQPRPKKGSRRVKKRE